ncbi:MAG TPA: hypothetical protein VGN42_22595, partial [Pirellulales bacterium]|nr:hypothetical protein [Pirellulales bacterium]
MLQVALTFENTAHDLQAAAAILEALRAAGSAEEAESAPIGVAVPMSPGTDPTAWKVARWFYRLGDGSRKFWTTAAEYMLTHPTFTFDELAAASGLTKGALRS